METNVNARMSQRSASVDVLIIGAGPAGLTLASWLRDCDISVLIIDKRDGPTTHGQAEGLKSTTVEIFETFGIGPQIWAEVWRLEEIAIWGQSPSSDGIRREQVLQDKVEELGKPRECMLQQSRVEFHLLKNIALSGNIKMRRNTEPTSLRIDECALGDKSAFPVRVSIRRSTGTQVCNDLKTRVLHGDSEDINDIKAKYVVGCDGAHSWTRKQIGSVLEGDFTDSIFGVMDFIPKTDFPDVRKVCYLRAAAGTILLVPRSNKEVRMYIPVESVGPLSDPNDITFDRIVDAAKKIVSPYSLEVGKLVWWSAYRVGQRVGTRYSMHDRVFLAGDAVHTHSPKAGQGMNTSIQDAYNLGWKLRLVLQGTLPPKALSTYESERRPVAQELIAFGRGYLKLFSARSASFDSEYLKAAKFTTGLSIRYSASCLVQAPEQRQPSLLKADVTPGKRLPDFQVVYQADGTTTWMHRRLKATGSFRILLFPGDISQAHLYEALQSAGVWLGDSDKGLGELTAGLELASVEVLVIHAARREDVELLDLSEVFRPWSDDTGYDYWRVFADVESAHEGHGRAYQRLEFDCQSGRCLVVRPDGYVGALMGMGDYDSIKAYFRPLIE